MLRLFGLVAVTLATMYFILIRVDTPVDADGPRAAASDAPSGFTLASFLPAAQAAPANTAKRHSAISEEEAVAMAIEAGREWRRQNQSDDNLLGLVAAIETPASPDESGADDFWYVTGTSVNLREGPSTSTSVVGQVSLGDAAETLSDTSDDWIQIRTAAGQTGWIFGRFLNPSQPG